MARATDPRDAKQGQARPPARLRIDWSRASATGLRTGGRRVDAWEASSGRRYSSWEVELHGARWMVVLDNASGEVDQAFDEAGHLVYDRKTSQEAPEEYRAPYPHA